MQILFLAIHLHSCHAVCGHTGAYRYLLVIPWLKQFKGLSTICSIVNIHNSVEQTLCVIVHKSGNPNSLFALCRIAVKIPKGMLPLIPDENSLMRAYMFT